MKPTLENECGDRMNENAQRLAEKLLRKFSIGQFEDATLHSFESASVDELAKGIEDVLAELKLELRGT